MRKELPCVETYRLKNITILILLLLNLFLLGLLLNFRCQQRHTSQELEQQLVRLFDYHGITLPEDLDADAPSLTPMGVSRSLTDEAAIAAYLLEENAHVEDQGGGIYTYTGVMGTVQFRSSGAFDYAPVSQDVSDPQAFFDGFLEAFGYQALSPSYSANSGTFSAVRQVEGYDVYNCTVSFRFSGQQLVSVAGSWVSTAETAPLPQPSYTAADALSQFLEYRSESGVVCNSVISVQPAYALQSSTPSTLQLSAKWQVVTDTYSYYVDCVTKEVQRIS